jgi:hypothetical protein
MQAIMKFLKDGLGRRKEADVVVSCQLPDVSNSIRSSNLTNAEK